jgi:hypothetical protein
MRKLKSKEKERVKALNELVSDAVALHNECVQQMAAYRAEAGELLFYLELHASFPMDERDFRDYSSLFSDLQRIDEKMHTVQAEVARMETLFAQFSRQYTRLINHLEKANAKAVSKILSAMDELALDLHVRSFNMKLDVDYRYSFFYYYRQKMMAILFN